MARHQRGECVHCGMQCYDYDDSSSSTPPHQLLTVTKPGRLLRSRCLDCHPLPRKTAPRNDSTTSRSREHLEQDVRDSDDSEVASDDSDGDASRMLPEALVMARHEWGQCIKCAMQCYDTVGERLVPVTLPGVLERGRCLLCCPLRRRKRTRRSSSRAVPRTATNAAHSVTPERKTATTPIYSTSQKDQPNHAGVNNAEAAEESVETDLEVEEGNQIEVASEPLSQTPTSHSPSQQGHSPAPLACTSQNPNIDQRLQRTRSSGSTVPRTTNAVPSVTPERNTAATPIYSTSQDDQPNHDGIENAEESVATDLEVEEGNQIEVASEPLSLTQTSQSPSQKGPSPVPLACTSQNAKIDDKHPNFSHAGPNRARNDETGSTVARAPSNTTTSSPETLFISDGNGDIYEGQLYEGTLVSGKGRFAHVCKEGEQKGKSNIYDGDIRNGWFEGQGKFHIANGGVYVGEFKMGQYSGHGKMKIAGGDIYEGEWKNDEMNGRGEYRYADGAVYCGEFKDWHKHGKGKMTWASKDTYDGEWKHDERHGKGTTKIIFSNNWTHVGQYKNGKEHGKGRLENHMTGVVYEGEFQNGQENGNGTMTCENGDVYKGEFKDGELHGKVTMTYNSGATYDGEYKIGKRDGFGIFRSSKGSYFGTWKEDLRCGYGTSIDENGNMCSGEWKNDKKHGKGQIRYTKSGKTKTGTWKNDQFFK